MANAQSKLDILIEAKRQGQGFQQTKADLKGLDQAAGSLSKGLGGIAAGVGVAGIVALGAAAASAAFDMARLSAQSTDVAASFEQMATASGQSAQAMEEGLREASRGAISDYDLQLTANRAMLLGVAQNTESMVALMDVARARSQAMGLTTAAAFGDIVTGIGRMSPLILDNLGIVVDQAAANRIYADSVGKVVSQLTEQEKKQSLVNAVIKDSAGLVTANAAAGDDAASNFERMDAAIANARDALGDLFQPAMIVVANAIADAAVAATEGMRGMTQEAVQQRTDVALLEAQLLAMTNEIGQLENGLRQIAAAGQTNSAVYQENAGKLAALKQEVAQTRAEYQNLIPSVQMANQDFQHISITADAARVAIDGAGNAASTAADKFVNMGLQARIAGEEFSTAFALSKSIAGAIDSAAAGAGSLFAGEMGGGAGLSRQKELSAELKTQVDLWREQGYSQKEISDVLLPGMVTQINQADRAMFSTATSTAKLSDEAKAANQAFESLKSTVAGVLSGALDSGTGVDPDDVLAKLGIPREDAVNESARRLADIAANGLKGQDWLGDFANDVPDIWQMIRLAQNPQEEAAYLLRDFQDGLLSSAIDKEKAKAIVKRQIMGDQNMAALAQEIASELAAEMGIPLQEALAAAQGTLGSGGATGAAGTDAAKSFNDGAQVGLEESNTGGVIVDTTISQLRASYSKLSTAGQDASKVWSSGFMSVIETNLSMPLINLLATLVTPGVMAQLAQRGTLTGSVTP